jgi:pimeloyl-ACP methyl ester carboxylesterase
LSSIVTDQGIVHYEAYGQGPPVILLHGWLGSWGYWLDTMKALGEDHRLYALDFWGFGDSGKRRERYLISDFVELVSQFMDRLGIAQGLVVGHSMGGTVALCLALSHPERVGKVAVVGSPVVGDSLHFLLRLAGYPWIAAMVWRMPVVLRWGIKAFSPQITREWRRWYDMQIRDLSRTTLEAFFTSVASLRRTDLRPQLPRLYRPVMSVHGVGDNVVNPNQADLIARYVSGARVEMMAHSRHFPMLDEPEAFNERLHSFLSQGDAAHLSDGTLSHGDAPARVAVPPPFTLRVLRGYSAARVYRQGSHPKDGRDAAPTGAPP